MAWSPQSLPRFSPIEVYPAATLAVRNLSSSGYKLAGDYSQRAEIARALRNEIPGLRKVIAGSADVFDASLCLLAPHDFLAGGAVAPEDLALGRREGWAWVHRTDA